MRSRRSLLIVVLIAVGCSVLLPLHSFAADSGDVRTHAEQSFDQLKQHTEQKDSSKAPPWLRHKVEDRTSYSSDQYLVGKGQGDMTKGPITCQRVSELSARTDLAKQIRILVKEHMVDRVRERTGREAEQDIELTREEIVQEYLQGVKIVDRQIDEENKTCSATAVMPKSQIQPKP
ncbi:MAG: LPP20 family lipoprotein, partial [Nitrospiraceae bacterium]